MVQKEDTSEEHWRDATDKHTIIVGIRMEQLSWTFFLLIYFLWIYMILNFLILFIDKNCKYSLIFVLLLDWLDKRRLSGENKLMPAAEDR